MSQTDQFINQVMRTAIAGLCQSIGWNSAHGTAIDTLADVWKRQLVNTAKSIQRFAEHDGRSECNINDAAMAFRDMNIAVPDLEEYMQNFEPVRLPYNVPNFPVPKESHLNLLRPGSAEVLTRPVHIHEYMPPWETEEKKEKRTSEMNGHGGAEASGVNGLGGDVEEMEEASEVTVKTEEPLSPQEPKLKELIEEQDIGAVVEIMDVEEKVEGEETTIKEESPATPPSGSSLPYSPFSSKTGKRFESSGENPALKRVRLELEEGHPLREIGSVMMTTSGFLSSNREGRLPDSRPPLNRDFFDPEPVVEKKKKNLPMTKIVEGIKKLDKEKENQTSGNDDMQLFGKPDKITVNEGKSRESIAQKYKERSKLSLKLTGGKKDFKYGDLKAEKLKIFKKKTLKGYEKYRSSKESSKKKIKLNRIEELEDEDDGLDEISSEEDFNEQQEKVKSQAREESAEKKQKKRDHELMLFMKSKKDKKREKLMIPKIKTTPSPVSASSDGSPEKKKRGRPRKVPDVSIPQLFGEPFTPILKLPKMPKKISPVEGMKKRPELNMKRVLPPPPDLISFMGASRLPTQPGLIPATFGPPPPLKLGGHLPPSISITPATPSISTVQNPMSSRDSKNSSLPLPSSVCSSVTITRIDMPNSQKLPSQYDTSSTPGIGSQHSPSVHISVSGRQSPLPAVLPIQPDSNSGITITPILMTGESSTTTTKSGSGLARLEEDMRTKEQKRKDKEKRKELKKEKKKEKRDKDKHKEKEKEKTVSLFETFEKVERAEKKKDKDRDRDRDRDKDKKKKKEAPPVVEQLIPKLTLKLHGNTAPIDSAGHSQRVKSPPPPKKIIFKPLLEASARKRTPSPELARFEPLVTRPSKSIKVSPPKPSPPVASSDKGSEGSKRGRPPGSGRGRGRPPKSASTSSSQAALVTETVGFYIDEHGTKVWICPCCSRQDDGSPMIGCDTCDDWYHFTCVGITETPDENTSWYCKRCRLKRKSKDTNPSFDYKKKIPKL